MEPIACTPRRRCGVDATVGRGEAPCIRMLAGTGAPAAVVTAIRSTSASCHTLPLGVDRKAIHAGKSSATAACTVAALTAGGREQVAHRLVTACRHPARSSNTSLCNTTCSRTRSSVATSSRLASLWPAWGARVRPAAPMTAVRALAAAKRTSGTTDRKWDRMQGTHVDNCGSKPCVA